MTAPGALVPKSMIRAIWPFRATRPSTALLRSPAVQFTSPSPPHAPQGEGGAPIGVVLEYHASSSSAAQESLRRRVRPSSSHASARTWRARRPPLLEAHTGDVPPRA